MKQRVISILIALIIVFCFCVNAHALAPVNAQDSNYIVSKCYTLSGGSKILQVIIEGLAKLLFIFVKNLLNGCIIGFLVVAFLLFKSKLSTPRRKKNAQDYKDSSNLRTNKDVFLYRVIEKHPRTDD